MYNEADLHNGWEVRVRNVPPTASYRWEENHIEFPARPNRPLARITSTLDGHTEEVPALPESTEWVNWIQEMTEYEMECNRLRLEVVQQEADFSFDYALVAWRKTATPLAEAGEWTREIPEDWEFPEALITHGVAEPCSDNPALDFINYELLNTIEAREIARGMAFPESGDDNTSPVTQAEVDAAIRSFQSPMGAPRPSGDMGGSTDSAKRRGEDVSPGEGSVDRPRPLHLAGRLVRRIKGS